MINTLLFKDNEASPWRITSIVGVTIAEMDVRSSTLGSSYNSHLNKKVSRVFNFLPTHTVWVFFNMKVEVKMSFESATS